MSPIEAVMVQQSFLMPALVELTACAAAGRPGLPGLP
jgi:hypothetical protein